MPMQNKINGDVEIQMDPIKGTADKRGPDSPLPKRKEEEESEDSLKQMVADMTGVALSRVDGNICFTILFRLMVLGGVLYVILSTTFLLMEFAQDPTEWVITTKVAEELKLPTISFCAVEEANDIGQSVLSFHIGHWRHKAKYESDPTQAGVEGNPGVWAVLWDGASVNGTILAPHQTPYEGKRQEWAKGWAAVGPGEECTHPENRKGATKQERCLALTGCKYHATSGSCYDAQKACEDLDSKCIELGNPSAGVTPQQECAASPRWYSWCPKTCGVCSDTDKDWVVDNTTFIDWEYGPEKPTEYGTGKTHKCIIFNKDGKLALKGPRSRFEIFVPWWFDERGAVDQVEIDLYEPGTDKQLGRKYWFGENKIQVGTISVHSRQSIDDKEPMVSYILQSSLVDVVSPLKGFKAEDYAKEHPGSEEHEWVGNALEFEPESFVVTASTEEYKSIQSVISEVGGMWAWVTLVIGLFYKELLPTKLNQKRRVYAFRFCRRA